VLMHRVPNITFIEAERLCE